MMGVKAWRIKSHLAHSVILGWKLQRKLTLLNENEVQMYYFLMKIDRDQKNH
jgi:hypothetical protein